MSSAAAAGNRAFGIDRGLPFPLADLGRADALLLVGANPAETMPPVVRYLDRAARARRPADRRRPAASPPTARPADLHLQPVPGTDLALANGAAAHRDRRGLRRPGLRRRRAPPASTRSARTRRRLVAGAGRAAHRRAGGRPARGRPRCSAPRGRRDHPDRPRRRAARQGHRHRHRVRSTWPSRSACPAGRGSGLRLPHRPGQRPGRPRARAEGRPAARLPQDRRPGGPRARRRGSGASTRTSCPARACSAYELLDALGTAGRAAGAAGLRLQPGGLGARGPRTCRGPAARRWTCWWSPTSCSRETAALADVVLPTAQWAEEDGTMTNLEGRVLLPPARRAPPPAGRAHRPGRSSPRSPSGSASPAAVPDRPARRSSPSCGRASRRRRRPTTPASPRTGSTPSDGVFWPCPTDGRTRARPRLFADRFATPDGRARFVAVEHRPAAEEPCADVPAATSPPAGCSRSTSPAPRPGGSPRCAGPRRRRSSSCTPTWPAGWASPTATPVRVATRRGELTAPARVSADDPAGHRLRAVPLGRRGPRQLGSPTTPSTRSPRMPEFKVCAVRVEQRMTGAGRRRRQRDGRRPPGRRAARAGTATGRSPCSAPSRTARTTGSCSPRCWPGTDRRAGRASWPRPPGTASTCASASR